MKDFKKASVQKYRTCVGAMLLCFMPYRIIYLTKKKTEICIKESKSIM